MDKRFGLKIHCIADIINVLKQQPEVEEAIIFGSRAMGTYKNGSDIDIALKGNKISFDTISSIRLRLDELPYLYMYDIIDYKKVSNPAVTAHIDELGIIFYKKQTMPSDWKTYKVNEVIEIKYGKDHKHLADGKIPLYGSGGIMRYVDTPLYEKESILIPRKGTLSNLFYLNIPFWSVDTMFYSKIKEGNNGKYLYYLLKSMDLASMNVGSAVPSLTTEVLNKVEINVPDLTTQTQIAQILTSLDDKIELNLLMNQTLEAMAQALFKEWFVDFKFPGFDGELIDGLPKGWRKCNLSDLVESVSKTFKFPDGKAIFLNTSDILEGKFLHTNYTNYEDLPGQAKKSIQNGDILFSEIRPANKRYAFVDFDASDYVVSTKLMVLRSKGLVDNLLVYFFMKSDEVLNQLQMLAESRSGTFPQITFFELSKIEINIPTNDVLELFTDFLKSSFNKIRENQSQIQTLTQTRDTLLPKLISGQIETKS